MCFGSKIKMQDMESIYAKEDEDAKDHDSRCLYRPQAGEI